MISYLGHRWRHFRLLMRAPYPTAAATAEQRRGMHMLFWDSVLAAISGSFYADFDVLYLLALGAASTVIGTRASIIGATALIAPLLGAWLVQKSGRRKRWALLGGGVIGRLSLTMMVAVPFLFTGESAVTAYVSFVVLQSFVASVGNPGASSLLGDVVPIRVRGRFLGTQMMAANVVRIAMVPLAGLIIKSIGGIPGYQVSFLLAALIGFSATSFYARVPEPPAPEGRRREGHPATSFLAGLPSLAAQRPFVLFCLVNIVLSFGVNLSGPFFTVYMVKDLGFEVDTISIIVTVSAVITAVGYGIAGRLIDRYGVDKISAISLILVPFLPVAWMFAHTPLQVILARGYGSIAWAGFQVALTPLLLRISPPELRTQAIALFHMVNAVPAMLAPLAAAWIYTNMGFQSNLLFSAIGRGLGGALLLYVVLRGMLNRPGEIDEGDSAQPSVTAA